MSDDATATRPHDPAAPDPDRRRARVRVLLVEDDREAARAIETLLAETPALDIAVSHAPSLAAAEAALDTFRPHLLLLDTILSDGDGWRWFMHQRQFREMPPVVVLSARDAVDQDEALADVLRDGAEDLVFKSDAVTLRRAVRYAIERNRDRKQLLDTSRRFRYLIENALDLIVIVDNEGTITYASPAAEHLLGLKPDELVGKQLSELVHVEDILRVRTLLHDIFSARHSERTADFRVGASDGAWHTLEVIGRLLPDARHVQAVLNARDITERRRAEKALFDREAELRQSQKMEAIGRLAGGIAHDFSNILTVIIGATDRALDRLEPGHALYEEITTVKRNAAHAADMTMQLLAFSRRQASAPTMLRLGDLAQGLARFIRPLIGEDVELDLMVSPSRARVQADRTQLEQVLLNLAINARDAMPAGGRLSITIAPVTLERDSQIGGEKIPKGAHALISVTDTGVGMDEETQARAFEPFFTTKEAGRGTGLGLSTVYGIVKQSGGVVALTSRPGSGTTVSVYLPLHEPETNASTVEIPSAQADLMGGHETILVVEDQPDVRDLVRDMLKFGGYSVLAAERPSVAEDICRAHSGRIDLLLTDVVMPDMSGHELADRVAVLRPETRVLFMSGYPDHPFTAGGQVSSAPLVPKPFTRQLLLTRVRQVLDA